MLCLPVHEAHCCMQVYLHATKFHHAVRALLVHLMLCVGIYHSRLTLPGASACP